MTPEQPHMTPSAPPLMTPPEGVNVFFLGGGSVSRWIKAGQKLPSDARAWSWEGLGAWLEPRQWPWGQMTEEDERQQKGGERTTR
jgi:hypothetical protein